MNTDRPPRKTLWVTMKAHEAVSSMQDLLASRLGYRVTQSEAIMRMSKALEREMENSK